jgi:hypothetical protein
MALVLNGSGITSANLVNGTIVDEDVADLAASKLTGALPAIDGSALTGNVGKVLQVVYARVTSGSLNTTSASYVDTGCAASITPKSSSSKILIQMNAHVYIDNNASGQWSAANFDITRGGTQVFQSSPGPTAGYTFGRYATDGAMRYMGIAPITYLDSPSTTSAVTYSLRVASRNGYSILLNTSYGHHNITLMEIAG